MRSVLVMAFLSMFALASFAAERPQTLEIDSWVGQRFVLMPKNAKAQQYGYQSFVPALPYAAWVGKVLTVEAVTPGAPALVTFRTESGATLRAESYGSIHDLVSLRDLEYARAQWKGKQLALRVAEILTVDAQDKFGSIKLGKGARVHVKDVVPGTFDYEPLRFLLVTQDGKEGFLDVQLTGTNVSPKLRGTDTFDELFATMP